MRHLPRTAERRRQGLELDGVGTRLAVLVAGGQKRPPAGNKMTGPIDQEEIEIRWIARGAPDRVEDRGRGGVVRHQQAVAVSVAITPAVEPLGHRLGIAHRGVKGRRLWHRVDADEQQPVAERCRYI